MPLYLQLALIYGITRGGALEWLSPQGEPARGNRGLPVKGQQAPGDAGTQGSFYAVCDHDRARQMALFARAGRENPVPYPRVYRLLSPRASEGPKGPRRCRYLGGKFAFGHLS